MFLPRNYCQIEKMGAKNVYGEPVPMQRVTEPCSIVKLERVSQHTTVRADSSSSRGHGEEMVSNNLILLTKTTVCEINDRLIVSGVQIRVGKIRPWYDVRGNLDHYAVSGELWEK